MHDNSKRIIIFGSTEEFNAAVAKYIGDGYMYTNNHLIHPETELIIKVNPKMKKFTKKKVSVRPTGYKRFFKSISWDGWSGNYLHRVKWQVFKGPIPTKYVIKFKDGDSLNTKLSNLECISRERMSSETITNTRVKHGNISEKSRLKKGPWIYCHQTKEVYCGLKETYEKLGIPYHGSAINKMINKTWRYKVNSNGKKYRYYVKTIHGYTFRWATEDEIQEWKEVNGE